MRKLNLCSGENQLVESAYAISLLVKNPIIKPGESFEIEAYLTGYGEPVDNKLQIYISTEGFLDVNDPGYIDVSGKQEGNLFKFGDKYKQRHDLEKVGFQIGLSSACFKTRDEYQKKLGSTPKGIIPMVMTETMVDSTPPILLHLNTNKNIRSGDYSIHLLFTYSSDEKNYFVSEKEATLHVTSWVERNITVLQRIGICLGLSALFAELIQTYYTILQYYRM